MANAKYDNLNVMLSNGKLNWMNDVIVGVLVSGATFNASHKTVAEALGPDGQNIAKLPIQGKSIGEDGSFRGWPLSFAGAQPDVSYQLLMAKDSFSGTGDLLAFFDTDDLGDPFTVQNVGTLILRPIVVQGIEPAILGVWLTP